MKKLNQFSKKKKNLQNYLSCMKTKVAIKKKKKIPPPPPRPEIGLALKALTLKHRMELISSFTVTAGWGL